MQQKDDFIISCISQEVVHSTLLYMGFLYGGQRGFNLRRSGWVENGLLAHSPLVVRFSCPPIHSEWGSRVWEGVDDWSFYPFYDLPCPCWTRVRPILHLDMKRPRLSWRGIEGHWYSSACRMIFLGLVGLLRMICYSSLLLFDMREKGDFSIIQNQSFSVSPCGCILDSQRNIWK